MSLVPFSVSARTALLIGQQNFTNAEGAIIELVKNTYDADSAYCLVLFDIPFADVPTVLDTQLLADYQLHDLIGAYYSPGKDSTYELKEELSAENLEALRKALNRHNRICIADSGQGMTSAIIAGQWMMIGTGNKERDYLSKEGRVQTGAKGIGRFALDRLGSLTRLWTKPKDSPEKGTYWEMDWQQFETPDLALSDITATVNNSEVISVEDCVSGVFGNFPWYKKIPAGTFANGTFIEISSLRDNWRLKEIEAAFKGLEALIPPKELLIPFRVFQAFAQQPLLFGEVETAFFNDYDYKMQARFDSETLSVHFEMTRNEVDLAAVNKRYRKVFEEAKPPYDLQTLKARIFSFTRPVEQVIKWKKTEANIDRLKAVGDFELTFYFLKNTSIRKDEFAYPMKEISPAERTKTLQRFGGIKIYRDSFRVRPYGDPGNDWLDLGRRVAQSPAGVGQRIGDWRVGSNQVAGIITISRVTNAELKDKSDRGSLVENDAFNQFKRILTGMINQFEIDRSTLYHPVYLFNEAEKRRLEDERILAEAQILAEKIYQQRVADEKKDAGEQPENHNGPEPGDNGQAEKDAYQQMAEETIRRFQQPEDKDAEIAQVRNLASLGLIMASFAHELRNVQYNTSEINDLEAIYERIVNEVARQTKDYRNGKDILELLKADNARVKHWVDYSLTSIKKDKRQRKELRFNDYFATLANDWHFPLADRFIELTVTPAEGTYSFRAFEMDMNTIFSNLITNSIDSFVSAEAVIDRTIGISHQVLDERVVIIYQDNGPGLPDVFSDRDEVFLPFTTSKKDKDGQDIGTGLGMYLVKNVIESYNGSVAILDSDFGFSLMIEFPTRKSNADV